MSNEHRAADPDRPDPDPGRLAHGPAAGPDFGNLPDDAADLTATERELESDLSRLRPTLKSAAPHELLRLAFRAGQTATAREVGTEARARRRLVLWRAAAAVLVGGLGVSLLSRPAPQVVDRERVRVVYIDRPVRAPGTETSAVADPDHSHDGAAVREQAPRPAEADAASHPTLPEFLAALDSPSRPLIPTADADYLSVRDAVLRLGMRVIPSPRASSPAAGPVTLETLLGPRTPPSREPARRGGVGAGLDEIKRFLTGGQT